MNDETLVTLEGDPSRDRVVSPAGVRRVVLIHEHGLGGRLVCDTSDDVDRLADFDAQSTATLSERPVQSHQVTTQQCATETAGALPQVRLDDEQRRDARRCVGGSRPCGIVGETEVPTEPDN